MCVGDREGDGTRVKPCVGERWGKRESVWERRCECVREDIDVYVSASREAKIQRVWVGRHIEQRERPDTSGLFLVCILFLGGCIF